MMNNYLALCLLIKDENAYIDEWINYHRSIGVERFFVYDNGSRLPIHASVADDTGVTFTYWPDHTLGKQQRAYYHCATMNRNVQWIGFIDTDEFIILRGKEKSLPEFLVDYEEYDGLAMSWLCYGTSGLEDGPNRFTDYKMRGSHKLPINQHIKSIVRTKALIEAGVPKDPHYFGVNTVNEHFKPVSGPFSPNTSTKIFVKHTITRSEREYREKMHRGRGDGAESGHNDEWFNVYNPLLNTVWDGREC